jgi:hypothetical protein
MIPPPAVRDYYTTPHSSLRARTSDADTEGATAENVNWNNVDIRDRQ